MPALQGGCLPETASRSHDGNGGGVRGRAGVLGAEELALELWIAGNFVLVSNAWLKPGRTAWVGWEVFFMDGGS